MQRVAQGAVGTRPASAEPQSGVRRANMEAANRKATWQPVGPLGAAALLAPSCTGRPGHQRGRSEDQAAESQAAARATTVQPMRPEKAVEPQAANCEATWQPVCPLRAAAPVAPPSKGKPVHWQGRSDGQAQQRWRPTPPTKQHRPKLEAMEMCRPTRTQHGTDEAPEHCRSRSRHRPAAGQPVEASRETRRPQNGRAQAAARATTLQPSNPEEAAEPQAADRVATWQPAAPLGAAALVAPSCKGRPLHQECRSEGRAQQRWRPTPPAKLHQPEPEAMETCRPSRAQHDAEEAPEHCGSRSGRRAPAG